MTSTFETTINSSINTLRNKGINHCVVFILMKYLNIKKSLNIYYVIVQYLF